MPLSRLFWIIFFVAAAVTQPSIAKEKVLLVLLDGLRWDLFDYDIPSLYRMGQEGVRADWLDSAFIPQSSPSMTSIATGLYVESHGVIHNKAFNSTTREMSASWEDGLNSTWWFDGGGEPVWVTAIKQGLKAGSFMYPGAQVPIQGIQPDKYVLFSYKVAEVYKNLKERVDVVLDWLDKDNLDVVFMYTTQLDDALHYTGISSDETKETVSHIQDTMEYILDKVMARGDLNLIVCSDHGHAEVGMTKWVELYDYINESMVDFIVADYGPLFHILPKEGDVETVYSNLKDAHPAMHVYKKEEFPERFHYANNPRALPIIGYVDSGWLPFTRYVPSGNRLMTEHGYDNRDMTMKGVFYGMGPSFRKGHRAKHLESSTVGRAPGESFGFTWSSATAADPGLGVKVNIYPLMCEILGIMPAPNNGSRDNYRDMLISEHPPTSPPTCGVSALKGHIPFTFACVFLSVWWLNY